MGLLSLLLLYYFFLLLFSSFFFHCIDNTCNYVWSTCFLTYYMNERERERGGGSRQAATERGEGWRR